LRGTRGSAYFSHARTWAKTASWAEQSGGIAPFVHQEHINEESTMASIEKIELARYRTELDDDVRHLVKKYCRIMGWEVPELDEAAARTLILQALRESLAKVEAA
jgi:hypothetical protein